MISVYIAYGTICLIFWLCYFASEREKRVNCSFKKLAAYYGAARLFPMLAFQERTTATWISLGLELVILAILFLYFERIHGSRSGKQAVRAYLFCPAAFPMVLMGNTTVMTMALIAVFLLCLSCTLAERKKLDLHTFVPDLGLITVSIYGLVFVTVALQQQLTVLDAGCKILIGVGILRILWKLRSGAAKAEEPDDAAVQERSHATGNLHLPDPLQVREHLCRKDVLLIAIFTLVFAAAVFWRLGSHEAPETFRQMDAQNERTSAVVLDFEGSQTISELKVFLGYQSNRIYDVSYRSDSSEQWSQITDNLLIKSVFYWNTITVQKQDVTQLKLELTQEDARIHELVCLDGNSKMIRPVNTDAYPELFDEQELYPETATYYDETMFDEIYHARTAYEFLHGLPIYETTHPPLGKILISIGISLFGMNPFGWRFICALAGILMIPLMYLWAHAIFGRRTMAACSTILVETLFMNLMLSRIATLDILVALFVMGMFATMYGFCQALEQKKSLKKQMIWLAGCGLFTALAIATKWTGVYAAAGIAVLLFRNLSVSLGGWNRWKEQASYLRRLCLWCILCFLLVPAAVYLLAYIPFTRVNPDQNLFEAAVSNAQLMLSYHSNTVFDHPYASEWYEWLIDRRPLLDTYTALGDGNISTAATFFNPLLCWGGLAALFHQFYLMKKKGDRTAEYLVIAYGSVLLPWLLIHRTVFIYQYFLGGLLLPLMILNSLRYAKHGKGLMIALSAVSVALFVLFFPVLTGIDTSADYVNQVLEWLPTWTLAI